MKLFFLLCCCAYSIIAKSQTCIIIYVHPSGITAGADRLYHNDNKIHYGKKIFLRNGIYRALSGADYNKMIYDAAAKISVKNQSLAVTVKQLRKRMLQQDFSQAMLQLLKTADKAQKERFKGNMTEVAFFKKEKGLYKAYRLTISMPGIYSGNAALHFETDSVVATKNREGFLVLGHYDAFDKYEKQVDWANPATAVRKLIRLQAQITPDDVSASSDIIQVKD